MTRPVLVRPDLNIFIPPEYDTYLIWCVTDICITLTACTVSLYLTQSYAQGRIDTIPKPDDTALPCFRDSGFLFAARTAISA